MKALKFRAWDEKRNRYVGDGEIVFKSYGSEATVVVCPNSQDYVGDICHDEYIDNDRFIVEQSTGIKDYEGKEIYEGDIIKVDSDKLMIPHEHTTKASEVFYSNYQTAFVYRTWYGEIPVGRHDTSVEVIGNVHENPELIGGKE